MPALEEGQRFERYRIIRLLGSGVSGETFEAEDTLLLRRVALKVLHPWSPLPEAARRQFFREMQGISMLNHRYLAAVLDYGEFNGRLYVARRYCSSGSLLGSDGRLWFSPPLNLADAIQYGHHLAQALEHVHTSGYLHGAFSLSNIMVLRGPNVEREADYAPFLLADVGLGNFVRRFGRPRQTPLPITAAPEQLGGRVTPASDQFALAVILYSWIGGRPPYIGSPEEVEQAKLSESFPALMSLNPKVSLDQEGIIRRALSVYPDERYPSTLAFADALLATLRRRTLTAPLPETPLQPAAIPETPPPEEQPANAVSQPLAPMGNIPETPSEFSPIAEAESAAPAPAEAAPERQPTTPAAYLQALLQVTSQAVTPLYNHDQSDQEAAAEPQPAADAAESARQVAGDIHAAADEDAAADQDSREAAEDGATAAVVEAPAPENAGSAWSEPERPDADAGDEREPEPGQDEREPEPALLAVGVDDEPAAARDEDEAEPALLVAAEGKPEPPPVEPQPVPSPIPIPDPTTLPGPVPVPTPHPEPPREPEPPAPEPAPGPPPEPAPNPLPTPMPVPNPVPSPGKHPGPAPIPVPWPSPTPDPDSDRAQPAALETAEPQPAAAQLFITPPSAEEPYEVRIENEEVTIGRAGSSDILLDRDGLTSRHHALLKRELGRYVIYDRRSANGVFVNDRQIEPERAYPLHNGDEITIGNYRLVFRITPSPSIDTPSSSDAYSSFVSRREADAMKSGPSA